MTIAKNMRRALFIAVYLLVKMAWLLALLPSIELD
jgi:hypothetical protein